MNRIKEIRTALMISQKDLAEKVGVSCPYLCDLEKNRRGARPETYQRIAEALNCSVMDLMKEAV